MGIDDSSDAFVINTDSIFDGTLANNSLSIDASHNMIIAGNLTVGGNIIKASDGGSTITMDTSDNVTIGNNLKVGGNIIQASDGGNTITMDTSDNVTIAGGLSSSGVTVHTRTSVTNLADDGSIPVTATCINIDANGGARTGIRFAGTGVAGQMIIVNNTGGEALTFHNTEGTALVRGIHADHDTMEANFMGMFVSDGTYWNLIAGGVDSQPDVGLTAS
jgi:hypothetical protein